MFYESRTHTSLPVADAAEAVRLIHHCKCTGFQCPTWKNQQGHRIALVSDADIDSANFFETAVINLDTREQYESITFGWCKNEADKLRYVQECENGTDFAQKNIVIAIDGNGQDQLARFSCGCCGTSFTSTISEQKQWDQDDGYGICPECVQYRSGRIV